MAKGKKTQKRRKHSASVAGQGANNYKSKLVKIGCIAAGIALGKIAKDKFTPTVQGVTGVDGITSAQMTSAAIAAAGVAGSVMLKNPYVKDVALGLGIAGTASVVNSLVGKSYIALGDVEEEPLLLEPQYEAVEGFEGESTVDPAFQGIDGDVDPAFVQGIGDVENVILS